MGNKRRESDYLGEIRNLQNKRLGKVPPAIGSDSRRTTLKYLQRKERKNTIEKLLQEDYMNKLENFQNKMKQNSRGSLNINDVMQFEDINYMKAKLEIGRLKGLTKSIDLKDIKNKGNIRKKGKKEEQQNAKETRRYKKRFEREREKSIVGDSSESEAAVVSSRSDAD